LQFYEFGPYRLDPTKRVLSRDGETISLRPKATEILMMLVMHAGELVEKEELLKEVWPNTFVEEANLTQNIFTLRRALGDERAGPKYIETVTRRGYRFVASVRLVGADDKQTLTTGKEVAVTQRPVVAVLPFLNATGDPELEYLADGITDNIINNLSRISKLRVMSRSTVLRYKTHRIDPQHVGKELGANVVLIGKLSARDSGMVIAVELVDAPHGWQLWGESFSSERLDILEVQETITRQLLSSLKLTLTGDEVKRATARYTENAEAYQSYLEGRYHWSHYTKKGIEKAIVHFRRAIELDPNYALAYAGIVDCYLRLATNYLPPEDDIVHQTPVNVKQPYESDPKIKLRFEWDWKSAERELRRANELKTGYPSAHQWYAAYKVTKQLYQESRVPKGHRAQTKLDIRDSPSCDLLPTNIAALQLTASEQVQVYCAIVREQIDSGNYEAACRILWPWWSLGEWPRLDGLNQQSCADLLFTAGELAGWIASTRQLPKGQKHGEELLNGSIALFEQLGFKRRAAEGRIELALCYYRQGLFNIGRSTLIRVLDDLSDEDWELRSLALIRLASLERHAGRPKDAVARLVEATATVELSGPWAAGRCHLELASTYKDLAISENEERYFDYAQQFYFKALCEFEAVGHHRYVAVVENNVGFLLLNLGSYKESEKHLLRSRKLFETFSDRVREAQVKETIARLYVDTKQYDRAHEVIEQAVKTLELTDGEALLAEALTTKGVVASRLGRNSDAKNSFEAAYKVAERCGDNEGAGRALLIMLEEMGDCVEHVEMIQISEKLEHLLTATQQTALQIRVQKCLARLALRSKENGED
jgi:DNA-binding winged helix-turn-helix (wHTH) protein/tetratricopeptide (TPR) repeat protein